MDRYATLRNGLVGAWCPSLGATGYTLPDRSGGNSHGTLTNMGGQSVWQGYPGGVALALDGTNDYAQSRNLPIYGTETRLTLSAWVRPANITQTKAILCLGNETTGQRRMMLQRNGQLEANGYIADYQGSSSVLVANDWQHLAIVYRSLSVGDVLLYRNGISLAGSVVGGSTLGTFTNRAATIGGNNAGGENWSGAIDDVRVYSRALTQAEIARLASRRGIGLVSQRQRRATLTGPQFSVNVSGTWRSATPWVNVGGTWKTAVPGTRVGGAWK